MDRDENHDHNQDGERINFISKFVINKLDNYFKRKSQILLCMKPGFFISREYMDSLDSIEFMTI
jgi:hypothetical protein